MGLCLGLWSLSQDRRPAIDSPQAVWEVRPTRLRVHFSHWPRFPFVLSMQWFHVGLRGGNCLMAGVHGVMIGVVEPEPGSPPGD